MTTRLPATTRLTSLYEHELFSSKLFLSSISFSFSLPFLLCRRRFPFPSRMGTSRRFWRPVRHFSMACSLQIALLPLRSCSMTASSFLNLRSNSAPKPGLLLKPPLSPPLRRLGNPQNQRKDQEEEVARTRAVKLMMMTGATRARRPSKKGPGGPNSPLPLPLLLPRKENLLVSLMPLS